MRSSKNRSRSKSNRNNNRPTGNVVNRVFDSSGPEGKVRGTPQQIIDKYNQLARDAQLSGDRVALENFQQHSEHYTRMLADANREQEARRIEQDRQREQQQQNRDRNDAQQGGQQNGQQSGQPNTQNTGRDGQAGDEQSGQPEVRRNTRRNPRRDDQVRPPIGDAQDAPQPDVDMPAAAATSDSSLVETPETSAPKPRRARTRKPAAPKPQPASEAPQTPEAPEAAE
jgi:hypothetical protein